MTRLTSEETQAELKDLGSEWTVNEKNQLIRHYTFPDFIQALAFVNQLGELAETRQHHPDIFLAWGRVTLTLWSHDIGGLSPRDFALAKEIDQLP